MPTIKKRRRCKVANAKAQIVFYGMRHVRWAKDRYTKHTRYYCAIESPDIVVEVTVTKPYATSWNDYERLDETMNALAKKFYPKAERFMFYNRVTHSGILPPKECRPPAKMTFQIEKALRTRK